MSSGAGGYNPEASLLSANPGVDLKVFAGGGGANEVGAAGGYNNSATLLRAPTDPLPVMKFSGGNTEDGKEDNEEGKEGDEETEISSLSTNASRAYNENPSQQLTATGTTNPEIPASIAPPSNMPDDQFNFVKDVLGFVEDFDAIDSIKMINSITQIKAINDSEAKILYDTLSVHDDKFKEFLRAKGIAVKNDIDIPSGNTEEVSE